MTLGYPKLQNLNRSLEKKLCYTKKAVKFSQAALGPGWLVNDIFDVEVLSHLP